MYQCISDRFDLGRCIYSSVEEFLRYCDQKFGRRPTLMPQEDGAHSYYDMVSFVLVKVEGPNVETLG